MKLGSSLEGDRGDRCDGRTTWRGERVRPKPHWIRVYEAVLAAIREGPPTMFKVGEARFMGSFGELGCIFLRRPCYACVGGQAKHRPGTFQPPSLLFQNVAMRSQAFAGLLGERRVLIVTSAARLHYNNWLVIEA